MAVNGIDIDLKSIGDIAVNMKKINAAIDDELKSISSEIDSLESIWSSPAQRALKEKFKTIGDKRDKFKHDLSAYADFLSEVAKEYGYVEKQLNRNAESFD